MTSIAPSQNVLGGALDKKTKRAIKGRLTELMMDPQQRNVADEIGLIFKLDGKEGKETKVCMRDIGSYVKFTSECYHKGFNCETIHPQNYPPHHRVVVELGSSSCWMPWGW